MFYKHHSSYLLVCNYFAARGKPAISSDMWTGPSGAWCLGQKDYFVWVGVGKNPWDFNFKVELLFCNITIIGHNVHAIMMSGTTLLDI